MHGFGVGYDVSSVNLSVLLGGRECSTRTSLSDLAIAEKFVFFFVFLFFFFFCFIGGWFDVLTTQAGVRKSEAAK